MKPKKLVATIEAALKAGLVPFIKGSPGLAKSSIVKQVANKLGYNLIDIRLTQMEACDLAGLPYPQAKDGTFKYLPLNIFPLKGVHKKPKKPTLLFLDEFSSAPADIQAAAYKLILDRAVGEHNLHKNVHIVCAGNLDTDRAITVPMSSALESRLMHLELEVNSESWLDWAYGKIDPLILGFIEFSPAHMNTFNHYLDSDDKTFACPRTLEMCSNYIRALGRSVEYGDTDAICGIIGNKAGAQLVTYAKNCANIPKFKDIVKDPRNTPVPSDTAELCALVANINEKFSKKHISECCTFVNRFPMEFQTMFYRSIGRNHPLLAISGPVKDWVNTNSDLFN